MPYYVTHASLRYRHPIDPVIMPLTAAGIIEMGRWLMSQRQAELEAERSITA